MRHETPHPWPKTVDEAKAIQLGLRERLVLEAPAGLRRERLAGLDISLDAAREEGYGGIVVLDGATLEPLDRAGSTVPLTFPYVPGYLSFRELPVLVAAWERLETRPDVLLFDGQGYAHPRRFGLACHGGLLFGVPSIGCAKSVLVGRYGELGEERGSTAPMVHRGEVVGMAVRTRDRVNPVFVSPGHLMDLSTAVEIVLQATGRFREPETTRHAHRMVGEMRRGAIDDRG